MAQNQSNGQTIDIPTIDHRFEGHVPERVICPITGQAFDASTGIKETRGWDSKLNRPAWVLVSPEGAEYDAH